MSEEDYGYPLSDHEGTFDDSITTEYIEEKFHDFSFNEFHFEFDAPDVTFRPVYYPERVVVGKKRDIVREKGICRNEYVKDVGTENREIHVVGTVTPFVDSELSGKKDGEDGEVNYRNNLQSFHDMVDFGQRGILLTMQWAGEVLVEDSDLEGPTGIDPKTGHFQYEYTLDFVSTGKDEMSNSTTGIINDGT